MLKTFKWVTPFVKLDPQRVTIDNGIFKLHYRWTFIILVLSTILVCSRQYIGTHIKCISYSIPSHVIETYCFFTPTFTLVRHLNNSALSAGTIFQPGIGPYETENEPIKRHAYYQWVPFVLFGQAVCFYMPHFLWKSWEGGRIKTLVFGLKMVSLTKYLQRDSHNIGGLTVPCMDEMEARIKCIRRTMIDRMRLNQSWGAHLVFVEILNLLNVMLQIYCTNLFLGGAFYSLGPKVLNERWTDQMDALDVVFPKVTKCHFRKFGASGSLQLHDTLCVMALNIINEKIYTILWFWFMFVLFASLLGLLWRAFTLFFYKSLKFTLCSLYWIKPGKLNETELSAVINKCNFSNWMFLIFLRSNVSEFLFEKVIYHLSSEFPEKQNDNTVNEYLAAEQSKSRLYPSNLKAMAIDEVDVPLINEPGASSKLP